MNCWAPIARRPRARRRHRIGWWFRRSDRVLRSTKYSSELDQRPVDGGFLDFQLNEEQLHLKKSVREFAEREIAPNVMKWDEAAEFHLAIIKELGTLGLMGAILPPEYGGAGMGYVEYVTAIEEISRAHV